MKIFHRNTQKLIFTQYIKIDKNNIDKYIQVADKLDAIGSNPLYFIPINNDYTRWAIQGKDKYNIYDSNKKTILSSIKTQKIKLIKRYTRNSQDYNYYHSYDNTHGCRFSFIKMIYSMKLKLMEDRSDCKLQWEQFIQETNRGTYITVFMLD